MKQSLDTNSGRELKIQCVIHTNMPHIPHIIYPNTPSKFSCGDKLNNLLSLPLNYCFNPSTIPAYSLVITL